MLSKLTESSQAASSRTLDAFAELICALAPEVCSVSFHDFEADTLLLTVPNQLGVAYNTHVLEAILTTVAPALGWR